MGIEGISSINSTKSPVNIGREKVDLPELKPINNNKDNANTNKQDEKISKDQIKQKVDAVNKFLQPEHTSIRFHFHEKLHEYYVDVVDTNTKKVLREIPPKKFLDMYASMLESIGLLVDHRI